MVIFLVLIPILKRGSFTLYLERSSIIFNGDSNPSYKNQTMENIFTLLQNFHLSIGEVLVTGLVVFIFGLWVGTQKVKRLNEKIYELQKDVLELNAEILFGKSETPVIEIKQDPQKSNKIAR
jgi:hypothetical protein